MTGSLISLLSPCSIPLYLRMFAFYLVGGDVCSLKNFKYGSKHPKHPLFGARTDGEIFNIGAGLPITLTNLATLLLKLTHKEHLKINYTVPRPGDILHSYADISKANRLLKFEPKYTQEKV